MSSYVSRHTSYHALLLLYARSASLLFCIKLYHSYMSLITEADKQRKWKAVMIMKYSILMSYTIPLLPAKHSHLHALIYSSLSHNSHLSLSLISSLLSLMSSLARQHSSLCHLFMWRKWWERGGISGESEEEESMVNEEWRMKKWRNDEGGVGEKTSQLSLSLSLLCNAVRAAPVSVSRLHIIYMLSFNSNISLAISFCSSLSRMPLLYLSSSHSSLYISCTRAISSLSIYLYFAPLPSLLYYILLPLLYSPPLLESEEAKILMAAEENEKQ